MTATTYVTILLLGIRNIGRKSLSLNVGGGGVGGVGGPNLDIHNYVIPNV